MKMASGLVAMIQQGLVGSIVENSEKINSDSVVDSCKIERDRNRERYYRKRNIKANGNLCVGMSQCAIVWAIPDGAHVCGD